MNFNGFLDDGAGASKLLSDAPYNNHFSFSAVDTMLGSAAIAPSQSLPFSSSGLSLGLQTNGEMSRNGEIMESNVSRKSSRGEDVESRSESDNAEAVSGDDLDTSDRPLKKKKRYHRHTPKQIQDLES
jgi:homeobox-leucine zipper protein